MIRPAPAPARLVLRDAPHWLSMYADREGAERLVALWALAARSAHSLIHLPLRANPAPERLGGGGIAGDPAVGAGSVPLDLVLVHHSPQFPTSSWKQVGARLGPGRPHTGAPRQVPGDLHIEYCDTWRL
ncbi:hypothetical protein [Streptomyces sp. NPDC051561]|uniref:hypothetical protein n=1 Tax=Streptomyces sp. NPDC051561 TaxID=3365658 RepID=UPI0037BA2F41